MRTVLIGATAAWHERSVARLVIATALALAGMWGFFLCAAGYVFQPAQVGPDHAAGGAIGGIVLFCVVMILVGPERE